MLRFFLLHHEKGVVPVVGDDSSNRIDSEFELHDDGSSSLNGNGSFVSVKGGCACKGAALFFGALIAYLEGKQDVRWLSNLILSGRACMGRELGDLLVEVLLKSTTKSCSGRYLTLLLCEKFNNSIFRSSQVERFLCRLLREATTETASPFPFKLRRKHEAQPNQLVIDLSHMLGISVDIRLGEGRCLSSGGTDGADVVLEQIGPDLRILIPQQQDAAFANDRNLENNPLVLYQNLPNDSVTTTEIDKRSFTYLLDGMEELIRLRRSIFPLLRETDILLCMALNGNHNLACETPERTIPFLTASETFTDTMKTSFREFPDDKIKGEDIEILAEACDTLITDNVVSRRQQIITGSYPQPIPSGVTRYNNNDSRYRRNNR